ncbi:MAG: DNA primase [Planctomycetota bacterium]|nr:DNA primase [Planctomycetota bacterium]
MERLLAGHIPEHIIAQVAQATDIVGVIGQYVELKKAGRDHKGLCPFHQEKTPSFTVSPEKQLFHCFGCKAGGSVFQFLMQQERMDFPEAVRYLADRNGVHIPEETGVDPRVRAAQKSDREGMLEALTKATAFFTNQLRSEAGTKARNYMQERRLGQSIIDLWELGYSPNSWDSLSRYLNNQGLNPGILTKAGLISQAQDGSRHYDRFRDRLMFPIRDVRERVIGFGARMLGQDDGPKYLNSPETPLFNKSACLYGLHRAKKAITEKGCAVVVEGYTDVLMAHQMGVENVIATLGTALTREHIGLLRRYAPRVVLVFDADAAGEKASDRSIDLFLEEDVDVSVATLEGGLDPCDFIQERGPQAFEEAILQAREILDYKLHQARNRYDFNSIDQKTRATEEILGLITKIQNPVKQSLFIQRAADELRVPEQTLRSQVASLARKSYHRRAEEPAAVPVVSAAFKAQRDLLACLLHFPEQGEALFHEVAVDDFMDGTFRTIYQVIRDIYDLEGAIDPVMTLSTLEARWPGQEVSRLTTEILAENVSEDLPKRVEGSKAWFKEQRARKELEDLKAEMKDAGSQGDSDLESQLLKKAQERFRKRRA